MENANHTVLVRGRGIHSTAHEPIILPDAAIPNGLEIMQFNMCIIRENGNVVVKYAKRGICKGKWNFPGGKIEHGELLRAGVFREIKTETGLSVGVNDLIYHGKLDSYIDGNNFISRVHIVSTNKFSGVLESSEEGPTMWVDIKLLHTLNMWKDVEKWLPLISEPVIFHAVCYYSQSKDELLGYSVSSKKRDERFDRGIVTGLRRPDKLRNVG
ncbi:MAG: 8-oxo-dGTP diphosphatase [Candidatus Micrarchaeaceae archaeon]|jgi:8-oxo-dGTP pyrophosphatase MutT (NUDIX family)